VGEPGLVRNLLSRCAEFSASQGREQIPRKDDPLSLPANETFVGEMIDAPFQRVPDLRAKPTATRRGRFSREKLAIQPGRARRRDLLWQGEIRAYGERKPSAATSVFVAARLHDRARRGIAGQLDIRELKVVRPAVYSLDDRKG
jgi:hypothetical protein